MKREIAHRSKLVGEQANRVTGELQKEIEGIVGKEELENFKKFAFKGHMMEMAIAFMLGAAFKSVVSSISNNLIMPLANYASQFTGSDWREMIWEPVKGLTFEIGPFLAAFVDFLLMAIILYVLWVKLIGSVFAPKEEKEWKIECCETIPCPYCLAKVHYLTARCPHCTSWIDEKGEV